MFCDLAGFATLSARVEAERLVQFLNAYPAVAAASREIFDGGTPAYDPRFRIGIASGQSIGSIGAEECRNYTVIGDTVNLASRIDGANRLYRTTNLVCSRTAEAIRRNFALREIDTVGLPAIDVPEAIFEIIGRAGQISAEKQELPRMGKTSLL